MRAKITSRLVVPHPNAMAHPSAVLPHTMPPERERQIKNSESTQTITPPPPPPVSTIEPAIISNTPSEESHDTSASANQHTDAKSICQGYLEKHAVIPGSSWGTLSTELQK